MGVIYEFCLMQILLIAATANEIELFVNDHENVDVLITGVGVPATIYNLQNRLCTHEYDFVIQAGIAGTFSKDFNLAETVLVKQDVFGDIGTEEKHVFTPITKTGFINAHHFPYADGWLMNMAGLPKHSTLKTVKAVTVNKITDDILQTQQLITAFNAQIETMEGAALHYVCLQKEVPFLQIRSISNYVGERDKSKWKMNEAFKNLATELQKLINQLNNQ
jgi:futalosine hydrolase